MKTDNIMIQTLCVPCACHCRYCLLDWNGKVFGADYERAKKYVSGFYSWLKANHPEIGFNFVIGCSMDHPNFSEVLDFMNETGSISGSFLQMDGLRMRNKEEQIQFLSMLKDHGVKSLNFTFYGLKEYHDKFSGRTGDFSYMMELLRKSLAMGFIISIGIPLFKDNANQADSLITLFESEGISSIRLFISHEEGRGKYMSDYRITLSDYEAFSDKAKAHLNRNIYLTEAEWCNKADISEEENRSLLLSLTHDNIDQIEGMDYPDVISYMEKLDDEYYSLIPSFKELLKMYGDVSSDKLYGKRDLYQHYQKLYIRDKGLKIYDVTDERYTGSRRF